MKPEGALDRTVAAPLSDISLEDAVCEIGMAMIHVAEADYLDATQQGHHIPVSIDRGYKEGEWSLTVGKQVIWNPGIF